jgi:protein TonB
MLFAAGLGFISDQNRNPNPAIEVEEVAATSVAPESKHFSPLPEIASELPIQDDFKPAPNPSFDSQMEPGLKPRPEMQVNRPIPRKVVLQKTHSKKSAFRITKAAPQAAIQKLSKKVEASLPVARIVPTQKESRSRPAEAGLDGAYVKRLASLIEAQKRYPGESLRNEEEGLVRLKVRINPRGEILGVFLQVSSGFKRLDRAALEALHSIKRLPAPPGATGELSLLVPIRFEILSRT